MRQLLSLSCLVLLAACAPAKPDPNQESASSYDSRTTTGSNIPRKGSAVTIDKSVIQDQQMRQGGSLQR